MSTSNDRVLLKDNDWRSIEDDLCRVVEFTSLAEVEKGGQIKKVASGMPYASVEIECQKIKGKIKGFITHKIDFAMLWAAFNEPSQIPGVHLEISNDLSQGEQDREVWLIWSKKRYKRMAGLFKAILPRLTIMVCPKGAYELTVNPNIRPELSGEKRFLATRPFAIWRPDVIK